MHFKKTHHLFMTAGIIICLFFFSASVFAKPNTLKREEIPEKYKWDLSHIYPSWEAWQADFDLLAKQIDDYVALKGTLAGGPDNLLKAMLAQDEMGKLAYKVYRYPALMQAEDSRVGEIAAKVQQVQNLFARSAINSAWFSPELLQIPWDTMEKWLNSTPGLAPYKYDIEDLYRQQKHVLDAEKEQLLSYYSRFNGTPVAAYSELTISDIQFPTIMLSNGKEVTMTRGNYGNILATNRNQEDRAKAFEEHYKVYAANTNTYSAMYNSILQRDWANAQARNYSSCLDAYLDGDNVPTDIYKNLIKTAKNGTDPVKRYMALRKKALAVDDYHFYDGGIPLVEINTVYDYDDVAGWLPDIFKPLGKKYGERIDYILKNRWIDTYENEGKTSGAFSASVYGVHPYMLMNYTETLDNVFTLAHELGHAMHSLYSQENQPFTTSSPTIFVAEVASTLNEALLLDYMLEHSKNPKEKIALLQQAIDNIFGTFYTQTLFAEFEWRAHELVEQGQPVTADVLKNLYMEIMDEYYGDSAVKDELYNITWARISHFYESPFYVYKYATCFASSAKIYNDLKSDDKKVRQQALDKYMTLLKSGGNDYPMEQLRKAGVDLANPETMQAVVLQMDNLVTQLEEELEKL
jgi:oligoendopeptidase F